MSNDRYQIHLDWLAAEAGLIMTWSSVRLSDWLPRLKTRSVLLDLLWVR